MNPPQTVRAETFDYELPPESIAQSAAEPRDSARLLVLGPEEPEHLRVRDLVTALAPGDLLVVNDTSVIPARLFATKSTGGAVELLALESLKTSEHGSTVRETWRTMLRASRAPRPAQH